MSAATKHTLKIKPETLKKVTVFNDRAELKREFTVDLAAGLNEVTIEAISQHVNDDSVRVTGRGPAVIEEVQVSQRRIAKGAVDSEKVAEIRKEKEQLEAERDKVDSEGQIVTKQSTALDGMVALLGTAKKDESSANAPSLDSITNLFAFHRKEVAQLREEFRELRKEHARLTALIAVKDQELKTMEKGGDMCKNVIVMLEAEEAASVTLEVTYQVGKAGWTPLYDIRVETKEGKTDMQLSYYANVHQSTGEEWEGAQLTLSTARPCIGGAIPDLKTLDVSLRRGVVFTSGTGLFGGAVVGEVSRQTVLFGGAPSASGSLFGAPAATAVAPPPPMVERQADVAEQTLSTEFAITRPCSIPADGAQHKVTIGIVMLSPQLVHESVPCKNASAFLTASAVNSSQLPLLAGKASVYLDGAFVAKTVVKAVSPGERFTASLGVDPAVRIEYKPAHKYHEQMGVFSNWSSTVTEQKIVVRNTRGDAVLLTIREQIPRSTDEKIRVRVISPDAFEKVPEEQQTSSEEKPKVGARMLPASILEWTVQLEKGASETLLVKYVLEHPSAEKLEFHERYV